MKFEQLQVPSGQVSRRTNGTLAHGYACNFANCCDLVFLVAIALSFPAIPAAAQKQGSAISISSEAVKVAKVIGGLRKGLSFSIVNGQDKAELIYLQDRRALLFTVTRGAASANASNVPIADKIRLLRALLKRVFADEGRASQYEFAVANYVELGPRVALAALQSDGWDAHRGLPVAGNPDRFVKNLLDEGNLYSELTDLAKEFGYVVAVTDVEHVFVESAGECDASLKVNLSGRKGAARVPCSMAVRFLMFQKKS